MKILTQRIRNILSRERTIKLFQIYIYLNISNANIDSRFLPYFISLRPLSLWQIFSPFVTPLSSSTPFVTLRKGPPHPSKTSWNYYSSAFLFCCTCPANLQQRVTIKLYLPCSIFPCCWALLKKNYTNMHSFYATSFVISKPSINPLPCLLSCPFLLPLA